jgi:hypothetical protein
LRAQLSFPQALRSPAWDSGFTKLVELNVKMLLKLPLPLDIVIVRPIAEESTPTRLTTPVDSAQAYRNEGKVGQAVRSTKTPRSQIFLTTKYMPTHQVHPSRNVYKELEKSIKKIDQVSEAGKEYVDLVLIHAPWGGEKGRAENWKALAEGQKEGWIKDIGVSNLCVCSCSLDKSLTERNTLACACVVYRH